MTQPLHLAIGFVPRVLTTIILLLLSTINITATYIVGTTPIQAKPPNQVHIDKRYGISNGPGQELFTGDVIVITVEETSPADGSVIFNTLAQGDNGDILCLDPTIPSSLQFTTQYANQFSNYQNAAFQQAYQGSGQAPPTFGQGAYGGGGYGSSPTLPDWSPSLVNMFVVQVVDGRLGILNLAPVVEFPNSPRYISPQASTTRSGVGSSIDRSAWQTQTPQHLAVNTFLQPLDSFYAFASASYPIFPPHLVTVPNGSYGSSTIAFPDEYDQNTQNKVFLRGSSKHGFCTCSSGRVQCPSNGDLGAKIIYPNLTNLDPTFSRFTITKIPYQVVRHLLENYRAVLQHGNPSTFTLLSSFPFIDRVDGLHFHGAEAQLSSRRLYIGQLRVTARGTKLEQQAIMVMRNLVSDTIRFTFNWGLNLIPELSLGSSVGAFIPGLPVTFQHKEGTKHSLVSDQELEADALSSESPQPSPFLAATQPNPFTNSDSPPTHSHHTLHQSDKPSSTSSIAPSGRRVSILNSQQPYHQKLLKQHLQDSLDPSSSPRSTQPLSHSPTSTPPSDFPYSPYIQHYSDIEYDTKSIKNKQKQGRGQTKQHTNLFSPSSNGQSVQTGNQDLKIVSNIFQFNAPSPESPSSQRPPLQQINQHQQDSKDRPETNTAASQRARQRIMDLLNFDQHELLLNSSNNTSTRPNTLQNPLQRNDPSMAGRSKMVTEHDRNLLIEQILREIPPMSQEPGDTSSNLHPSSGYGDSKASQQTFGLNGQYNWFRDRNDSHKRLHQLLDIPFPSSREAITTLGAATNPTSSPHPPPTHIFPTFSTPSLELHFPTAHDTHHDLAHLDDYSTSNPIPQQTAPQDSHSPSAHPFLATFVAFFSKLFHQLRESGCSTHNPPPSQPIDTSETDINQLVLQIYLIFNLGPDFFTSLDPGSPTINSFQSASDFAHNVSQCLQDESRPTLSQSPHCAQLHLLQLDPPTPADTSDPLSVVYFAWQNQCETSYQNDMLAFHTCLLESQLSPSLNESNPVNSSNLINSTLSHTICLAQQQERILESVDFIHQLFSTPLQLDPATPPLKRLGLTLTKFHDETLQYERTMKETNSSPTPPKSPSYHLATILSHLVHYQQAQSPRFRTELKSMLTSYSDSLHQPLSQQPSAAASPGRASFQQRFSGQHSIRVQAEVPTSSPKPSTSVSSEPQDAVLDASSNTVFSTLAALFTSTLDPISPTPVSSTAPPRPFTKSSPNTKSQPRQPIQSQTGLGDTTDMVDLRSYISRSNPGPPASPHPSHKSDHFSQFEPFSMPHSYSQSQRSSHHSASDHPINSPQPIHQINVLHHLGDVAEKQPTKRMVSDSLPSTPVKLSHQTLSQQPQHQYQPHSDHRPEVNESINIHQAPVSNPNSTASLHAPPIASNLVPNLMSLSPSYPFILRSPPNLKSVDPLSSKQSSAKLDFPSLTRSLQAQYSESQDKLKNSHPYNASPNQPHKTQAPLSTLSPLDNVHTMSTMQAIIPGLLNSVLFSFPIQIALGIDVDFGTVLELAGECALISPPTSSSVGHAVQHIGFTTIPFSIDLVRPEWYWNALWVADWHLASRPVDVFPVIGTAVVAMSQSQKGSVVSDEPQTAVAHNRTTSTTGSAMSHQANTSHFLTLAGQVGLTSVINRSQDTEPSPSSMAAHRKHVTPMQSGSVEVNTRPTLRPGPFSDVVDAVSVVSNANTVPIGNAGECIDPFTFDNTADRFTIQRASLDNNIYSLSNPLGLIHPAMEQHHFALSGTYTATNTMFLEYVIERVG